MVCCELSEHLKQMEIDFNINIQFLNTLSQKLNIIQTNSLANLFSYSLSNDFSKTKIMGLLIITTPLFFFLNYFILY